MLAGDTHPGGTTTAALEECSRVKISRLPVQLRDNRKPQEGQSGRAATKSRLASGEGVPLLGQEGWTRHQENAAKPPFEGAAGVVSSAKHFVRATTPSPLLFQEGNIPPDDLRSPEKKSFCGSVFRL